MLAPAVGTAEPQLGVALRLLALGQVGLGHLWLERVWWREQSGQTREGVGQCCVRWPKPRQFLHCVYRLEEYARSIGLDSEKSLIEYPMTGTSPGLTKTITDVADLLALDSEFGLRYLAERISTFFVLRMETARLGKSSSGSSGRKASGKD